MSGSGFVVVRIDGGFWTANEASGRGADGLADHAIRAVRETYRHLNGETEKIRRDPTFLESVRTAYDNARTKARSGEPPRTVLVRFTRPSRPLPSGPPFLYRTPPSFRRREGR